GERLVDAVALALELALAVRQLKDPPFGEGRAVAVNLAPDEDDRLAILELLEERRGRGVDEPDARPSQDQGPCVRIAAGRRIRDVHDRRDPAGYEVLRGNLVDVTVVDDRDIAGLDPADE